jgi:hypothetical protein
LKEVSRVRGLIEGRSIIDSIKRNALFCLLSWCQS